FRHEAEVRLICLADSGARSDVVSVDMKPNELFTDVRFDPRLAPFERIEREQMARLRGYTGKITHNERYQGWLFDVGRPDTCENLDAAQQPESGTPIAQEKS